MVNERDRNLLKHDGIPAVFSNRNLAKEVTEGLRRETMTLGDLELIKLQRINHVLEHVELYRMIEEGKLTLGAVKPFANDGNDLPENDQEAAEILLNEIGQENIIFTFSTILSDQNVEDFYRAIKSDYINMPSEVEGKTVWELITGFSKSGPLTFVLLYREEGDAVDWWREKMGATKPNEADPISIRGRHAIQENLPNNLVHGSDSIKSVHREIDVLKVITRELATKAVDVKRLMPQGQTLKQLGIVPQDGEILAIERIFDSGMRSESWIFGYQVIIDSQDKGVQRIFFKEKNIISLGEILKKRQKENIAV